MKTLQQISQVASHWSLDELVQVANEILPQFLPEEKAHTRVREAVSPRLIRHYTSQGMLDEPLKEGREARYSYRHLLQILLVRRLLTEGYGASVIDTLARTKPNSDLEALLQGGLQLTLTPANPALAFLQTVQQRQASDHSEHHSERSRLPLSAQPVPPPLHNLADKPSHWTRLEVLPGLELHVRSDFALPTTSQEQHRLWQRMLQLLQSIPLPKRRSSNL